MCVVSLERRVVRIENDPPVLDVLMMKPTQKDDVGRVERRPALPDTEAMVRFVSSGESIAESMPTTARSRSEN